MARNKQTPPTEPPADFDRGLPDNLDAERYLIGSVLLDGGRFDEVRASVEPDDFSLEKHRRIWMRLDDLRAASQPIDRVTLAEELMRNKELESVDGLTYIVSLDEGLPAIHNLRAYAEIVKEKSVLRKTIFQCQTIINRCMDMSRPADVVPEADSLRLLLGSQQGKNKPETPLEIVENFPGGLASFMDPKSRPEGLKTGFYKLDEMTSGMHPQDLIIVAGATSSGKTSWAMCVAQHACLKLSKSVMVFSLEMNKVSLLTRMMCGMARVDLQRFRLGRLDDGERRRLQGSMSDLAEAKLHIDDTSGVSVVDLHSRVRHQMATEPVDLVVVDYLQLMHGNGKFDNRAQEVSSISRGLKLLAKEINAPVMALSQFSRKPDHRKSNRPQLSDLKESSSLEQDADTVLFVYRDELFRPDREDNRGQAELIIAKQRHGPIGTVKLVFLNHLTRFENMSLDLQPPEEYERGGKDASSQ